MGRCSKTLVANMEKKIDTPITLFNLSFFGGQLPDLLTVLTDRLTEGARGDNETLTVATPNPEQVIQTRNNPEFLRALQTMNVRLPDGIGLLYASKILSMRYGGPTLRHRIGGRDVVAQLLRWADSAPVTVLVIGGRSLGQEAESEEEILVENSVVGKSLVAEHPKGGKVAKGKQEAGAGVDVGVGAGTGVGVTRLKQVSVPDRLANPHWLWTEAYQDAKHATPAEEATLRAILEDLRPDLVLVALGAPDQELWLDSHRELLSATGVKVAMAVGGALDVLTGALKQPPAWVIRANLEWAFRLWQQPWRWKRQLRLLQFGTLVLRGLVDRSVGQPVDQTPD